MVCRCPPLPKRHRCRETKIFKEIVAAVQVTGPGDAFNPVKMLPEIGSV
jgi:hypothetical protein